MAFFSHTILFFTSYQHVKSYFFENHDLVKYDQISSLKTYQYVYLSVCIILHVYVNILSHKYPFCSKIKKISMNPALFFQPKLTLNLERFSEEYIHPSILLVSGPGLFVSWKITTKYKFASRQFTMIEGRTMSSNLFYQYSWYLNC